MVGEAEIIAGNHRDMGFIQHQFGKFNGIPGDGATFTQWLAE